MHKILICCVFCHQEQDSDEKFKTTAQDLEGFWDMVLLQVDDVYTMFAEIETLRRNGWIHIADDIALVCRGLGRVYA